MRSVFSKALVLAVSAAVLVVPLLAQQAQQAQQAQAGKSAGEKINLNSASLDELQKLPRIGPKVAQRIIDFRKQNGPFKRVEDLMKVRGIGEKLFSQLKDRITV
jgi:competence protein ComEA